VVMTNDPRRCHRFRRGQSEFKPRQNILNDAKKRENTSAKAHALVD